MRDKIFIQIASYRDPELIPTVLDLFEKAKHPDELDIVVAWQHDKNESIFAIKDLLLEHIDIPFAESKGVCWAREKLQRLYKNQTYTLQLDSHHRFVKNWDAILISEYNKALELGSQKPIISTYLPNYEVFTEEKSTELWKIKPYKFLENNGPLIFCPDKIHNSENLVDPIRSTFLSAHFLFTKGNFCIEVPYDTDYYFFGEELNLSARAFTHGYDVYCPIRHIAYHSYNRKHRHTHWEDHPESWKQLDSNSVKKHNCFFSDSAFVAQNYPKNYIGKKRKLQDFITRTGVDFVNRKLECHDKKL